MKRAWIILGVVGLTALITYLAVSLYLSQQRATRLDRALMDAEARLMQLEAEAEAAKQPFTGTQQPSASTSPSATAATAQVAQPGAGSSGPWSRYAAVASGGLTNRVRIEGTSSVHDWQVESRLIGGSAEFGPGFPAGTGAPAGPIEARVSAFIPVRSLKSVKQDGTPYSDAMDEIMYGKLRAEDHKRIIYSLTSLTLKEQPRDTGAPFLCEATGKLSVAGETNTVTMPVTMLPTADGKIQFTGSVRVKMTDFKITPPSPSLGGVSIKTGDEVTLSFAWWVNRMTTLNAAK